MNLPSSKFNYFSLCFAILLISIITFPINSAGAQDRLPTMPNYAHYMQKSRETSDLRRSLQTSDIRGSWKQDGSGYEYQKDGKAYRYDIVAHKSVEIDKIAEQPQRQFGRRGGGGGGLERGRQTSNAPSPDAKHKAIYKDNNLWLSDADGSNLIALTKDGSKETRVKYGTGSWVYGEELVQTSAFWWSPDSKKLAYYRFDEGKVKDYYLAMNASGIQDSIDVEPYPKAGADNPVVDLFIYDLDSKQTTHVDVRDGKPFEDSAIGYYVYDVRWSPDGTELLFNRTNRKQDKMELAACAPQNSHCRVVFREEWPASWVENHPQMDFLNDKNRYILSSERNGFKNLYLYNLQGEHLADLTSHKFEVGKVVQIDEKNGVVYYMARSGDNHMMMQLHRVKLDGTGDKRLTDSAFNHTIQLSPDCSCFADRMETHSISPSTRICSNEGKVLETLSKPDLLKLSQVSAIQGELFTYKAADGKTDLYGMLYKPSNFDPGMKYPLLVSIYAGPESEMLTENFGLGNAITELGFLFASFDARGTNGRGKQFKDTVYDKLGVVEIDDQAEGVKFLRNRPYVDGAHVGIYGTSYGGYASAMAILRYPDVFHAASASSSVTDWQNYDTIYTERYMYTPQENKAGYEAGSAMTYAKNLKGKLLLYYGTADNNVHPANTFQLVKALQRAGKGYDLQVGPDQGHSGVRFEKMLEFFIDNLQGK